MTVRICVAMFVCSCVVGRISNDVNCNNSCAFPRENMINKSHIHTSYIVGLQIVCTIYNLVCYVYDQRSYIISLLV